MLSITHTKGFDNGISSAHSRKDQVYGSVSDDLSRDVVITRPVVMILHR